MLPYPGDPSHQTLWVNDQSQRVGPQFLAGLKWRQGPA